jgi:hypothetical protein
VLRSKLLKGLRNTSSRETDEALVHESSWDIKGVALLTTVFSLLRF